MEKFGGVVERRRKYAIFPSPENRKKFRSRSKYDKSQNKLHALIELDALYFLSIVLGCVCLMHGLLKLRNETPKKFRTKSDNVAL